MSPGDTQPVSFAFRKRDEVFVMVDGVDVSSNLYEWVNDGLIRALNGFPSGTITRIERRTPVAGYESSQSGSSVYDWQGANANFRQSLFVIQEYADKEVRRNEQIDEVTQYVGDMEQAVQAAAQSAANANLAASSAAANAAEAVSDVLGKAQAAAEAAQQAADRADQFDPLNFYTRAQADSTFLTSLSAETGFFTKTQINEKFTSYYTKTAVDTAMGQRVAKSGDAMTGNLTIQKAFPLIEYRGTGTDKWWTYHDTGNAYFTASYNESPKFQITPGGAVWTAQLGDLNTKIEDRSQAWANNRVAAMAVRLTGRNRLDAWNPTNGTYEAPSGTVITGYEAVTSGSRIITGWTYRYLQLFDPVRGWTSSWYD